MEATKTLLDLNDEILQVKLEKAVLRDALSRLVTATEGIKTNNLHFKRLITNCKELVKSGGK